MSDVIAVLDQLNRDLAEMQHHHRRKGEEAYPGRPGEVPNLSAEKYDGLIAQCDHECAIAMGIDYARQKVLAVRESLEQEQVIH